MATPRHKTRGHAKLSASGSSRWLACTPSPRLESRIVDKGSDYAREGTLAHEFADLYLNHFLAGTLESPEHLKGKSQLEQNEFFSGSMHGYVEEYTDYVLGRWSHYLGNHESPQIHIEQRLNFSEYVPKGFGTGDVTIVGGSHLELIDLKYGQGVKVDAVRNSQLMLYGLGALYEFDLEYEIKTVTLTIVQPRLNSISSWEVSADDLRAWGENYVLPRAKDAFEGVGETVAGSHCRFCKAKSTCRAYHEMSLSLARQEFAFADPDTMSEEELLEVYKLMPTLSDWAKTVNDYMYAQAKDGNPPKGYKLVAKRGRRQWSDKEAVAAALSANGYEQETTHSTKLKGIGDISSLMSKDDFEQMLGEFVIKPQGAPILVPESDKRPALGAEDALADFENLVEVVK